ncbi:unnamed protein product [Rotaria sp. Silwood1]|nr:unnamed protein product [Rotaria sp. Silwood1]CAF1689150.1 unnamed protein product [Rotaria sp. Silwood1]CAF3845380.1 unnamed protein product [Rotaria sp. Silwood1]CAF4982361.1 unnamed protein product [Rotaria sp. Silwood1]
MEYFVLHKSRFSEQTDHELDANRCTLSCSKERECDVPFALVNEQIKTIFIRRNNNHHRPSMDYMNKFTNLFYKKFS